MAKNSIRDFDNTAGNNTDIQSVDIAEQCAPSGINNAIRELMADMADVNDGTVALVSPAMDSADINGGTIDGATIGGTTPAAGTFTTGDFNTSLNVDGTVTSDGLTVDGKVLINAPSDTLAQEIRGRSSDDIGYLQFSNNAGTTSSYIGSTGGYLGFETGGSEVMRLTGGSVGIGESNPASYGSFVVTGTGAVGNFNASSGAALVQLYENGAGRFGIQTLNGSAGANFTVAGSTKMTLDTSGNLLVGSTNTDGFDGTSGLKVANSSVGFLLEKTGTRSWLQYIDGAGSFILYDSTDNQNRLVVDSSGNLLVGKTTPSISTTGSELRSDGYVIATFDGDAPLYLNRLTSDGDIAKFYKDGTAVGSIGTLSGYITIGRDDTAIVFQSAEDNIQPFNQTTNSGRDAAIDLGKDTVRFKDLFLSGSVYLGGTGSANALDDYEEGTWTASVIGTGSDPTVTYGARTGSYTKVGRLVHIALHLNMNSFSGGSGNMRIGGLPFTIDASSVAYQSGGVGYANDFTNCPRGLLFEDNTTRIRTYRANSSSAQTAELNTELTNSDYSSSSDLYIFGTYFTD